MHALFLDAMGTLVELADPVPRLCAALLDRCEVEVSPDRARAALTAEIAFYRAHMHEGADPDGVAALRRACAGVLADALGPPLDDVDPERVTRALLDALHFSAYPDAPRCLARVRAATPDCRIVVVSNWDRSLEEVLERVGLRGLLDDVITSAQVGSAKPDPAIFRAALRRAGVSAQDALHVGDGPDEDVRGAAGAGIRSVLVRRAGTRLAPGAVPPGTEVIPSLDALLTSPR